MQHPLRIIAATPVLRVADVGKSLDWYRENLGFTADPFPEKPPYEFCILRHGECEIMLRKGSAPTNPSCAQDWDVYIRLSGGRIRELYANLSTKPSLLRRLERMFYGQAEFELTDPDGYGICIAEPLTEMSDLPTPQE
jgi:uncharacterized glyoxalase superfamily protein PhnB